MSTEAERAPAPAVSVIIAVRDGAEHVPGLRAMLDAQLLRDFEVVVVDDASSDGTSQLLRTWSEESEGVPVRVVRMDRQGGASAARRAGVLVARGERVWFADADDRFDADLLSKARGVAEEHRADVVCFRARAEHEDGSRHPVALYGQPAPTSVRVAEGRAAVDAAFSGAVMGYLWDKLFSRDLVTRAFAETEDLRTHEDLLLLLHLLTLRPRLVLAPGTPYAYVVRPTSLSNAHHPSHHDLLRCAEQADRVAGQLEPGRYYGTFLARYIGLSAVEDAVRKGDSADVRAAAGTCGPRLRAASPRQVARDHGWALAARVAAARFAPAAYGRVYRVVRGAARMARGVGR